MTTEERKKILEKIQNMLMRAASTDSEHEAETALRLAAQMMTKYNISEDEVGHKEESKNVEVKYFNIHSGNRWENILAVVICDAFDGINIGLRSKQEDGTYILTRVAVTAKPHDMVMIEWYFQRLRMVVGRATDQVSARTRNDFALGMVTVIGDRLKKYKSYVEEEMTNDQRALVPMKLKEVQDKFKELFPNVKVTQAKVKSEAAYNAGCDTGSKVSLSTPVGGSAQKESTKINGRLALGGK